MNIHGFGLLILRMVGEDEGDNDEDSIDDGDEDTDGVDVVRMMMWWCDGYNDGDVTMTMNVMIIVVTLVARMVVIVGLIKKNR